MKSRTVSSKGEWSGGHFIWHHAWRACLRYGRKRFGKSTLLRVLAGQLQSTSGEVIP